MMPRQAEYVHPFSDFVSTWSHGRAPTSTSRSMRSLKNSRSESVMYLLSTHPASQLLAPVIFLCRVRNAPSMCMSARAHPASTPEANPKSARPLPTSPAEKCSLTSPEYRQTDAPLHPPQAPSSLSSSPDVRGRAAPETNLVPSEGHTKPVSRHEPCPEASNTATPPCTSIYIVR